MWPKKTKIGGLSVVKFEPGVTVTKNTTIITVRERSKADAYKVEFLKDLLSIIASEDLDAMLLTMLQSLHDLGYNLKDTPENLVGRIRYEATK